MKRIIFGGILASVAIILMLLDKIAAAYIGVESSMTIEAAGLLGIITWVGILLVFFGYRSKRKVISG